MSKKGFPFDSFTTSTNQLMLSMGISQNLIDFASANIAMNDIAHRHDHVEDVILKVVEYYGLIYGDLMQIHLNQKRMAVIAALLHDIGCWMDRDGHHLVASNWVFSLEDDLFSQRFYGMINDELGTIAMAVMEHRASWGHRRVSAVSDIVAAADRGSFCPVEYLRRAYLFGRSKFKLSESESQVRAVEHFMDKYKEGGYVYTAIPEICLQFNQAGIAQIKAAAANKDWCTDTVAENMADWEAVYEEMTNASS